MRLIRNVAPPLVTLLIVLAAWSYATRSGGLPSYLLPRPSAVALALWAGLSTGEFWPHIIFTLTSTLTGYAIGSALAVCAGVMVAESRLFERSVFPYIVAIQATPKVAIAPLILVWFGFGLASKIVLVALICFFPLLVNTISGIRRTDPELIAMARSFSRPAWWVFLHIKLPAAASAIFAGLEIGVVLALIGAVVGEFVAAERGVGYLIGSATVNMNVAVMFAGVLILAVFGILSSLAVRWIQRRVVFWEQPASDFPTGERP
jgi:NitT/TauT family transport system permease protein